MQIVLLDADTLGNDVNLDSLAALGRVVTYDKTVPDVLLTRCKDAEVIITNKVRLDSSVLAAVPALKLICVAATGTNNVDIDTARKHGIAVTNVAGYSTSSVVQHTLSMVLWQMSKLGQAHDHVQTGAYTKSGLFTWTALPFDELAGACWGIIGLGTIGRGVALAANALGCEVVWSSASGSTRDEAWPRVELDTLLQRADIISIHAPLTEKNRGYIGARELSLLRPHARLYNLGRGGLLDEAALAVALTENRLASAGLDVFEEESLSLASPLLGINDPVKLLLTPHIAWSSRQSRQRLIDGMAENIRAWQAGQRRNRVD